MGVWVELHCDAREEDLWVRYNLIRCLTNNNEGPREMAQNSKGSMLQVHSRLVQQGRDAGWRTLSGRWTCPNCIQIRQRRGGRC